MAEIAIIFDIGEVLCFPPNFSAEDQWIEENIRSMRENRDAWTEVEEKFAKLNREASLGNVTEEEYKEQAKMILKLDEATATEWMDTVWADCVGVLNDELVRYFKGLRKRCKTGLLSNSFVGSSRRRELAHRFELITDEVIYSNDVGLLKPDARIYQVMCNRLGVIPKDAYFLDDKEANVEAARALGMTGCLYRSNKSAIASIEAWLAERSS
jgi:epoxide hydrolase-like predicted phosphatase